MTVKKISLLIISFGIMLGILMPISVNAGTPLFKDVCKNAPDSTVCKEAEKTENPLFGPSGVITKVVNILTIIIGIAAVVIIILAGLKFITSGNNPQEVTKAREMILYALVGVTVAGIAQFIVRVFIDRVIS